MNFELEIIHWLQSFRSTILDFFFQFWTMFGEELIIIGILGFLYWIYDKKIGERVGVTVFISLVLNSTIKILVSRPRPYVVDSNVQNIRPDTATGYAFPSGHTQGAATLFTSFAIWLKKNWISVSATVIIVMVALSRMYLGAHYLSDVIVGGLLGVGISFVMAWYFRKNLDEHKLYLFILEGTLIVTFLTYMYFLFTSKATAELSNASVLYNNIEGLAKMAGSIIGFIFGVSFEKKKVNFETHHHVLKNLIRFILGIAVVMAVRILLKAIFGVFINPEELLEGELLKSSIALLFDLIRYLSMVFIGIGVYPMLFKKVRI
ncbi:MAG: phosphatase PAP2 family protein [Candidatus Izemoplasmatales bacterium]